MSQPGGNRPDPQELGLTQLMGSGRAANNAVA